MDQQPTAMTDTAAVQRELSRRRVFRFFSLFMLIAFAGLIKEEGDIFTHVLDEYFLVGGGLLVLILSYLWRGKQSLQELRRQNAIFTWIFAVVLAVQIWAIPMEINDKEDFGNDIPSFILLIITLLNKFI